MSKSRGRDGLLGVGGQRRKLSRKAFRGDSGSMPPAGHDPVAQKKELLRKLQERSQQATKHQDGDA
ncbi:DUF6243 family protein [Actinomadura fulvescens]|uniref:Uncharacterized protein n=1 Tax=Actinomadura fulvescens TaxID=46160 RepID=A0ABP6CL31_9ACTN